jgi:methylated-DNA-[protein]-cysteine S-methyltransferase
MKHNPDMATIPCHRVVGTDGTMHGYAFGEGEVTKERLLREEGVRFAGHKVDLNTALWQ